MSFPKIFPTISYPYLLRYESATQMLFLCSFRMDFTGADAGHSKILDNKWAGPLESACECVLLRPNDHTMCCFIAQWRMYKYLPGRDFLH